MKKRSRFPGIYVVLILLLLYLPIAVVIAYSFNDTKLFHWAGFTFSWYGKLFHNQTLINAFFNSLELALISSASAAVLGTLGAVGLSGRHFRARGAYSAGKPRIAGRASAAPGGEQSAHGLRAP